MYAGGAESVVAKVGRPRKYQFIYDMQASTYGSSEREGPPSFHLLCGVHTRSIQVDSLTEQYRKLQKEKGLSPSAAFNATFYCRICHVPASACDVVYPGSQHDHACYKVLTTLYPSLPVVYEWPCFMGEGVRTKHIDVWLPTAELAIEVDGEYHFARMGYEMLGSKRRKCSGELDDVVCRDEAFSKAVLYGNIAVHRLLRLHYLDRHEWPQCISWALQLCRAGDVDRFLMFSTSYMHNHVIMRKCRLPCTCSRERLGPCSRKSDVYKRLPGWRSQQHSSIQISRPTYPDTMEWA